MRLDLKENIVFPFSDPSWIAKTLIAAACQLLLLPMPAVMGYQLAIIRQTANGEDDKLPEFNNFGALWMSGLMVSLVVLALFGIPMVLVTGMTIGGAIAFGENSGGAIALVAMLALGLVCLGSMVLAFLMPAMLLRYAMTGQVSSFLDFSTAIGDIKVGFVDYLVIVLFPMVASLALGVVSAMTFGIGGLLAIPASALIVFIQGRMIGNYYRLYFM